MDLTKLRRVALDAAEAEADVGPFRRKTTTSGLATAAAATVTTGSSSSFVTGSCEEDFVSMMRFEFGAFFSTMIFEFGAFFLMMRFGAGFLILLGSPIGGWDFNLW